MVNRNEKLATPEEMAGLPDLPALESATTDGGLFPPLLIMGTFSLFYTTVVVWGYLRYREFMDDSGKIMVGIVVLSAIWVVGRVALAYSSFKIDRSGLTLRGPLRRRSIPWTEVREARTIVTRSGQYCVLLDTVQGQIRILPRGFGLRSSSGNGIIVSIWQNLKQMGRAEGMLLPKTALGFWEPVPDDVPEEMEWGKPSGKRNAIGMVVLIGFLIAIPGCLWIIEIPRSIWQLAIYVLLTLCWLMMLKVLMIPEITRFAYVVNVRNSYLECTLLWSKVHIPWSDVASANWRANYLIIRTRDRREVWIRYHLGDKDSENLIFALIRKLRTAVTSQVMALPERVSADPELLNRQAYSSEQQGRLQRAFLNTLDEVARRKIRRLWGLNVSLFLIGMIFGIILGFSDLVGILARFIHMRPGSGTIHFLMVDTIFYCVFMFVFMVGGGVFGEWLGLRLAGPYRDEWRRYVTVGSGSGKLRKVLIYAASIIGIISLLTVPLVMDCYARVTDNGFAVNHFFELRERFYQWNQVRAVEEQIMSNITNGKPNSRSVFVIKFADGYCWRMDESNIRGSRQDELRKAVEFVARKSGKEIVWR